MGLENSDKGKEIRLIIIQEYFLFNPNTDTTNPKDLHYAYEGYAPASVKFI